MNCDKLLMLEQKNKYSVMSIFHELILISLGKMEGFTRRLNDEDWQLLYREAQRQSLVGVLLTGVEKVVAKGESKPRLLMQWIAQVLALENWNRMLNVRCKQITDIFYGFGVRSCVLKGQGVALLYPNPLRRQYGDIDLWVDGNRDDIYNILKAKWKVGDTFIHHTDVEIFRDVLTEIHFIPSFTYSPFLYHRYKIFFKKWADRQFANYDEKVGFSHPTPHFNAVYSLMHIFHHVLYEGIGFRHFLDYYYILRNLDSGLKAKVFEDMKYLGLAKFAEAVMYVEQEIFGLESKFWLCQPNEKMGKCLLAEIEIAGNFGQFDERRNYANHKSKISVYLHNVKRNFVFFKMAPSEVLWAPIWKPCHFVWRKIKGYS